MPSEIDSLLVVLAIFAVLILYIVIPVVIVRWVLRINDIVSILNEQTDYLEDIAFRLKRCAEKMGIMDDLKEQ